MSRTKYIFALFIFCTFVLSSQAASSAWQKARVIKVLPNGEILFGNHISAPLAGINYKALNQTDDCFRRIILKQLNTQWTSIDIQWRSEGQSILAKNTKLGNLSQYLLQKGMARLNSENLSTYYKAKFKAAEQEAQDKNLGIWNGCSREHGRNKEKNIRKKLHFINQYEGFLAPVSSGKVIEVISGHQIKLQNGAKVQLLGINVPEKQEEGIEQCFSQQSKQYLESLILGRTVILRADRVDFNRHGVLLRYIYLPSWRKNSDEFFINQHLIESGYAKSAWEGKNEKYKETFEALQQKIYQEPKGAWSYCFAKELERRNEKSEESEVAYDENCPIKGNISGTKSAPIKKYHTPLSPWYSRITKPERCFVSEEEATQAGFEKVR